VTGYAQYHTNLWTRATFTYAATKKIRTDAELQYRMQNGMNNHNMYEDPLLLSCRTWVHYQPDRDIKLSVSPFALFSNYRIIQHAGDEQALPGHEIRFAAAAEGQKKLAEKWWATGRIATEYRMWQSSQTNVLRTRMRAGLKYEAGKRLSIVAYDELLTNVAGAPEGHGYDHNRIATGAGLQLTQWLRTEAGYMYIDRLPMTNTNHVYEHNVYLNVVTDIGKLLHTTHR
jgi:hypothetical protein